MAVSKVDTIQDRELRESQTETETEAVSKVDTITDRQRTGNHGQVIPVYWVAPEAPRDDMRHGLAQCQCTGQGTRRMRNAIECW